MNNSKEIHDLAIAYIFHRYICGNPKTPEEFFEDYECAIEEFSIRMAQQNR